MSRDCEKSATQLVSLCRQQEVCLRLLHPASNTLNYCWPLIITQTLCVCPITGVLPGVHARAAAGTGLACTASSCEQRCLGASVLKKALLSLRAQRGLSITAFFCAVLSAYRDNTHKAVVQQNTHKCCTHLVPTHRALEVQHQSVSES